MRRLCLLAALAAGSAVLHAQCSGSPCISSLKSGFASEGSSASNGASITAGTPNTPNGFYLYVNGSFSVGLQPSVRWTSGLAPKGQTLGLVSVSTTQLIASVPPSLYAVQDSASVTVLQGSNSSPSNAATFTINPPLAQLTLPVGMVGQPYSQPLASGGTGPYSIVLYTGTLPPGIASTYTGDGTSQANTDLIGTPTAAGTYTYSIYITDAWENYILASGSLTINPAIPPPAITSLNPASCTVSASATAGCTTGPFPLQISGSNFFNGLTVIWDNSTLGLGTVNSQALLTFSVPHNVLTVGMHSVSVLSANGVASNSLPFVVNPAPVIASLQPSSVTAGSAAFPMTVTGLNFLTGMTVQLQGSFGTSVLIPSALSTAQLTVTVPASLVATSGSASVVVLSADSVPVASNSLTLTVNPAQLAIITPALASMPVGSSLNVAFAARGGTPPYTFSSSGTLPPNAQFSSSGALTATLNTPGTYTFTVTVTDSVRGTASQSYTITVTGTALAIATTSPLVSGHVGVAYPGVQFQASGGLPPYNWAAVLVMNTGAPVTPTAPAPPGMSFSASGALSGTPTAAGNYSIGVTVTDSARATASGSFAITIAGALAITTASLPNGTVGTPYSAPNMTATGGVGALTWSATGLPAGITLSATGVFSGTPTAAGAPTVRITVTDSQGSTASQSYTLTVAALPLSIAPAGAVPAATVGSSFSVGFTAKGGTPPYTFSATGLPAGLSVSATTGGISGTPTAPGSSSVTVTVKDSAGVTASTTITVNVTLPAAPPLNFTGISSSVNPASQSSVGVGLGAPYPLDVTVKLSLTFTGADPAVQFATGGTTATITVPAGQTVGLTTVGVQTGTVAGTITITAQLTAGAANITPTPAPTSTITVPATAPAIASIATARTSTGFTVTIVGYSSPLAVTTANFQFTGTNLGTTTLSVPVSTIFAAWYGSSSAAQYGSNFTYTQPFTTSNPQAVTSVSVTLVNSVGNSTAASANLQ